MPDPNDRPRLLAQIDELLKEAYSLPRTRASFTRREQIEWELVHLFREIADRSTGALPYWADDGEQEDAEASGAPDQTN